MPLDHPQVAIADLVTLYKYDNSLQFVLPGQGESRVDCHRWHYIGHVIDDRIHAIHRLKSCHRRECPVCYPDWITREALSIYDRISEYERLTGRRPVHYVVSPPQDIKYDTVDLFRDLRKKAYRIAKQRGIRGGVMMFHQRDDRTPDHRYLQAHCSSGPHFHIVGDGWLSDKVKEFFLGDGWIVKNLRMRTKKEIVGTVKYIMGHLAIPVQSQGITAVSHSMNVRLAAVTWFGSMSYNKLKSEKYIGSGTIYCPVCKDEIPKTDWYFLDWVDMKDPPDDPFGVYEEGQTGFHVGRPIAMWSGFE